MNSYSRFILCLIFLIRATCACAQDVGFSQFYEQPLLRNPALAGIFTGDMRFTASYRNQWQSVTIPYRTFGLSTEIKFPFRVKNQDLTLTTGLQLLRDVAGTSEFSTTHVMPALNLSVPLGDYSFLSLGFMGGLMQQRFDPSKLVLNDQFLAGSNGTFTILPYSQQVFNNTSVNYFDLSSGLSFSTSFDDNTDFYAGVGLFHLANPKVGFFEGNEIMLNKKFTVNLGISRMVGERDELILYGDYFGQYKNFKRTGIATFQAGIILSHDLSVYEDETRKVSAGLLYRLDDAIIPIIQLQVADFIVGASYDANINKLSVASQAKGGFELTLSFKNLFKYRQSDLRGVICPKFGKRKT